MTLSLRRDSTKKRLPRRQRCGEKLWMRETPAKAIVQVEREVFFQIKTRGIMIVTKSYNWNSSSSQSHDQEQNNSLLIHPSVFIPGTGFSHFHSYSIHYSPRFLLLIRVCTKEKFIKPFFSIMIIISICIHLTQSKVAFVYLMPACYTHEDQMHTFFNPNYICWLWQRTTQKIWSWLWWITFQRERRKWRKMVTSEKRALLSWSTYFFSKKTREA